MPGDREPKTSPRRLAVALRRAEALKMRLDGARYEDIATALKYASRSAAVQDVQRALVATVNEPAEELRALELQRLDDMWCRLDESRAVVLEVLRRKHITVSNGKVITLDGEPLEDDGPILQAVDRLNHIEDRKLRIQERRAKYLGLDAPKAFEVVTIDAVDAQIRALTEELEAADRAAEELDGTEAPEAAGAQAASD